MIRIVRQISYLKGFPSLVCGSSSRAHFIGSKPCYLFGEKKEPDGGKGVSGHDVWLNLSSLSKSLWQQSQRMNKYQFGVLLLVPLLLWLSREDETEEYPINYFEDGITSNSNQFNELEVQVHISKSGATYKVLFERDNKTYIVNYSNNYDRVQKMLGRLHEGVKVHYKYDENYEIKLAKPVLIAQIISVLFITAFFLKTSSMGSSSSGIKKNSGSASNLAAQFLNNKKTFEVITNTGVRFRDVAGLDQSKLEVQQFVDFLKNPAKYKKLGARIPKGVLLSGPPGTGKTMLAKACAGEAGVPFIPTSGSDFVQIFVGVGASRVRDLFATAKEKSPSIIFIDEIDAVGRKRSGSHGSHDERDNTLNQILVEMDGFQTDNNVIVMAATNRQNLLDTALIRPGRFDRIVEVNLPDLEGRRQIFNVHLQKIQVEKTQSKDDYARRLASLTPGFSGAQIANLCNEAALLAARGNKELVDAHDFEMATERIIGGIEKKNIVSSQEKRIVSIHECGHAVVSWFLEGANPLLKLTIIPRSKGSLGFAQYFSNENKLNTRTELIDQICFILGGRCAEEYFFGKITNGASDDLEKAYQIAHNVVVKLGMNERVGYVGFKDSEYLRPYSEQMGAEIDQQIMALIAQCTERTRAMVKKYQPQIQALSQELFQKETLTIKDIRKILGEREFKSHEAYEKYLEIEKQNQSLRSQAPL